MPRSIDEICFCEHNTAKQHNKEPAQESDNLGKKRTPMYVAYRCKVCKTTCRLVLKKEFGGEA